MAESNSILGIIEDVIDELKDAFFGNPRYSDMAHLAQKSGYAYIKKSYTNRLDLGVRGLSIFRKYGGLTPTQYNAQIEQEAKERKAADKASDDAKENGILLTNSISQIDAVLNSNALETVVGPNIFARGTARQKGLISTGVSFLTRGIAGGGFTGEISGQADDTVALTQQMLDQQFLDKLIDVKSKGATFGALSDNEGAALRNAANAIASTAIKKDDRVVGYDMSEETFKSQMKIIQDTMRRAYVKATGESFTSEEKSTLDAIYGASDMLNFNPVF